MYLLVRHGSCSSNQKYTKTGIYSYVFFYELFSINPHPDLLCTHAPVYIKVLVLRNGAVSFGQRLMWSRWTMGAWITTENIAHHDSINKVEVRVKSIHVNFIIHEPRTRPRVSPGSQQLHCAHNI